MAVDIVLGRRNKPNKLKTSQNNNNDEYINSFFMSQTNGCSIVDEAQGEQGKCRILLSIFHAYTIFTCYCLLCYRDCSQTIEDTGPVARKCRGKG